MSRFAKALLIVELVVCFAPVALMLALGLLVVPFGLVAAIWHGDFHFVSLLPLVLVIGGAIGVVGLLAALSTMLSGTRSRFPPKVILVFAMIGIASLLPIAIGPVDSHWWRLLGFFPILAGLHVLYLARVHLFPNRFVNIEAGR